MRQNLFFRYAPSTSKETEGKRKKKIRCDCYLITNSYSIFTGQRDNNSHLVFYWLTNQKLVDSQVKVHTVEVGME